VPTQGGRPGRRVTDSVWGWPPRVERSGGVPVRRSEGESGPQAAAHPL